MPRLAIHNVVKTFPGVRAVDDVSFEVEPGEVHALIGENGAGKSTLMHLVAGVYQSDSGTIELDGQSHDRPATSRRRPTPAIAMVFQERSLVGALSVAENIYAGRQPSNRFGMITAQADARGRAAHPHRPRSRHRSRARTVDHLSPGQQQMVEIAKGLSHELKLIILDEPTSSLTINEARHLFRVIRRLAAQGISIVYVSHRMAEIFEISDRVTVLKDGRVTGVREHRG